MRTIRRHPHTNLPIVPLGRRKDGRLIWPILGASEDDSDDGDASEDDESDDADDSADDQDESEDSDDESDDGSDKLGDAGKKALDRMKAKLKEERAKRREAEQKLADKGDGDDGDDAAAELLARATERILKSEVKAAAAGKLADPADAHRFLDLASFEVDDDGNVDEDEIADAIDDLIKEKPYLAAQGGRRFKGSADGGARKETRPKQLTRADLARMSPEQINQAKADGRLNDLLAGKH